MQRRYIGIRATLTLQNLIVILINPICRRMELIYYLRAQGFPLRQAKVVKVDEFISQILPIVEAPINPPLGPQELVPRPPHGDIGVRHGHELLVVVRPFHPHVEPPTRAAGVLGRDVNPLPSIDGQVVLPHGDGGGVRARVNDL